MAKIILSDVVGAKTIKVEKHTIAFSVVNGFYRAHFIELGDIYETLNPKTLLRRVNETIKFIKL